MNCCAANSGDPDAPNASHAGGPADLVDAGYRFALSLVGHKQDAEDLAQQAWLRLTRRYGLVDNRSLLFRAIRNLVIDQKRRERIVSFQPLCADTDSPSRPARGEAIDVETAFQALRPGERECLYLHAVEGFRSEEIVRLTNLPRGTVLSHIFRGRKRLAAMLGRELR